jgi:hypothetical protein
MMFAGILFGRNKDILLKIVIDERSFLSDENFVKCDNLDHFLSCILLTKLQLTGFENILGLLFPS